MSDLWFEHARLLRHRSCWWRLLGRAFEALVPAGEVAHLAARAGPVACVAPFLLLWVEFIPSQSHDVLEEVVPYWMREAWDRDGGSTVEVRGEPLSIERRAHQDQLEVAPPSARIAEQSQRHVGIHRPLMHLIDKDVGDPGKVWN